MPGWESSREFVKARSSFRETGIESMKSIFSARYGSKVIVRPEGTLMKECVIKRLTAVYIVLRKGDTNTLTQLNSFISFY